ncbi:hypothetical protein RCH12_003733, partial [Cryobacterium sp. MP_3.1]|uniref:DNA methyltransferase n=1 Tax=Cryobacterium sp. MP_3.1 TaxID=3071711 RepID=UPI002E0978ED|nr:hypothetical protein [Cryobacterium sp. MP_3.1]
ERFSLTIARWFPTLLIQRAKPRNYTTQGDATAASKALTKLMGSKVFDNPKNTDVIARLVHSLSGDGDLVVDFFAGSGSTGQAVWEQNLADSRTRQWVLVQIPEVPDAGEESGKNAIKAGYKTIFEVTAERLRRSAALLQENTLDANELGFRVFRTKPTNLIIDPPIVATAGMTGETYIQEALFWAHAEPVREDADPFAVAWEVVLKASATQLDARVTTHVVEGITVYEFTPANGSGDSGRLLVSLDAFSLATADALAITDADTLILRGDKVDDATTLTLAPRLQSKLMLLERVPREVSL